MIGEVEPVELQSFVSACPLVESGMAETLVVHVDWRGSVVAVNQGTRLEEAIYKVRFTYIIEGARKKNSKICL